MSEYPLTKYLISVDACTGMLPDGKPRYVMGVVRHPSHIFFPRPLLIFKFSFLRGIPKIWSCLWRSARICLIVYGPHEQG